jgi:hypothetical protein
MVTGWNASERCTTNRLSFLIFPFCIASIHVFSVHRFSVQTFSIT